MTIQNFAAVSSCLLLVGASLINVYKIFKGEVKPALSTWLIILAASLMSFISYLRAEHNGFLYGLLNFGDVISTLLISGAIIFFSPIKVSIRPFEKYYLAALVLIAIFWVVTSKAFVSNLLIQILMTMGYGPTIHKLISEKKNTESFTVWGLILCASVISLYPAWQGFVMHHNILSIVYSVRAVVLLVTTLVLMKYYSVYQLNKRF